MQAVHGATYKTVNQPAWLPVVMVVLDRSSTLNSNQTVMLDMSSTFCSILSAGNTAYGKYCHHEGLSDARCHRGLDFY